MVPSAYNSAVAEVPVEYCSKGPELKAPIFSGHLTVEAQVPMDSRCEREASAFVTKNAKFHCADVEVADCPHA